MWIFISIFTIIALLLGLVVMGSRSTSQSFPTGTLKVARLSPSSFYSPGRMIMVRINNTSPSALMLGSPYRVERKETGEIVVGTSKLKAIVLAGVGKKSASPQTVAPIQLTGTNHGPWRLLLP